MKHLAQLLFENQTDNEPHKFYTFRHIIRPAIVHTYTLTFRTCIIQHS